MATVVEICNAALRRIGVRQTIQQLDDPTEEAEACSDLFPLALDEITAEFAWPFLTLHSQLALVAAPYAAWSNLTTYAQGAQVTLAGTSGYFVSTQGTNLGNQPAVSGSAFWTYVPVYSRTGWNYMYALPSTLVEMQRVQWQVDHGIEGPYIPSPPIPQPWPLRQPLPGFDEEWKLEASDALDGTMYLLTNAVAAEVLYTASAQNITTFQPAFSVALTWLLVRDLAMTIANKAEYAKPAEAAYDKYLHKAIARALNTGQKQREPPSEFLTAR